MNSSPVTPDVQAALLRHFDVFKAALDEAPSTFRAESLEAAMRVFRDTLHANGSPRIRATPQTLPYLRLSQDEMEQPLGTLTPELPSFAVALLKRQCILTWGDLLERSADNLRTLPGCGNTTVDQIRRHLPRDLSLAPPDYALLTPPLGQTWVPLRKRAVLSGRLPKAPLCELRATPKTPMTVAFFDHIRQEIAGNLTELGICRVEHLLNQTAGDILALDWSKRVYAWGSKVTSFKPDLVIEIIEAMLETYNLELRAS